VIVKTRPTIQLYDQRIWISHLRFSHLKAPTHNLSRCLAGTPQKSGVVPQSIKLHSVLKVKAFLQTDHVMKNPSTQENATQGYYKCRKKKL